MVKSKILILCLVFVLTIFSEYFVEAGTLNKKAVMIIAQNNFRDEELLQPKKILESAGVIVKVASQKRSEAIGMLGAKVKPNMNIKDIKAQNFDIIVFVGGNGARVFWDDPVAHKIAQDAYDNNKILAAICIAPVILAKAGLLNGKRATVWASEVGALKSAGAIYTARPVEVDGKVITASGPSAAIEFGKEILKTVALSE